MYTQSAGFTTRSAPVKTKEQVKVSRICHRPSTARRNSMKPGPVTIIVLKA